MLERRDGSGDTPKVVRAKTRRERRLCQDTRSVQMSRYAMELTGMERGGYSVSGS